MMDGSELPYLSDIGRSPRTPLKEPGYGSAARGFAAAALKDEPFAGSFFVSFGSEFDP